MFILDLSIPESYPFEPPKVTFRTKIYHCNISSEGYIDLDILDNDWMPSMTIEKVLQSIRSFLTDCNPNSCLRPEIAVQYVLNRKIQDKICSKWTKKYEIEAF